MNQFNAFTILAVSNAPIRLETFANPLKAAGNNIICASNLTAAIKLASKQLPKLIILDNQIGSPLNEACEKFRSNRETANTPLLLITPRLGVNAELFDSYHPQEFLLEPFNDFQLVALVTNLIIRDQALQETEGHYREIFNNTNDILYTHDLQGRYTSLNRKGRELTGYTNAEAATIDFTKVASTKDVELSRRMLKLKLERGTSEPTFYEIELFTKDGRKLPVEICSQLMFKDGKPVGVLGIARDITARRQSEEALRLANQSLRDANHRASDDFHRLSQRVSALAQVLSAARDHSSVFAALLEFIQSTVPCQTALMALYNAERNEALPQFIWTNDSEQYELRNQQPILIQTGPAGLAIISKEAITSNNLTSESIHKISASLNPNQNDNHPRLSIMTIPMTTTEKVVGILEIQTTEPDAYTEEQKTPMTTAANLAANAIENIRLITRDRDRESQLHQAQKMETLGRLAGNVAHDFNNIITAIYGDCDLAMMQLDPGHDVRQHLIDIKDCGKRAQLLSKQLLGFSRKQILQPTTLNMNKVIEDSLNFIDKLLGEDITVDSHLADNLPLAYLDKHQIEQILMNLAVNSRDAMPKGGRITIETHTSRSTEGNAHGRRAKAAQAEILLTFSDTGCGMDQETQNQIFEPFFTTKDEGKGTGLGLSMVYGSIRQAGGSISVKSQLGKGTTFSIRFPVSRRTNQLRKDENIDQVDQHKGSQTILIAEDNFRVRSTVRSALESANYLVLEASDGYEALDLFNETPSLINLIVTDLLMPKMNGMDLARQAQKVTPTVKVLFMSGYSNEIITQEGILEAGIAFIHKPFNHNEMLRKVREVLESREPQKALLPA
jgi:PAS domain S-box-containing protein